MPLNKESLADQLFKEIRDLIVNVEIQPGEKIDVTLLEQKFDVSRAPIREALNRLANQGLVEVRPRVGYFAVELTPKQIKDICELRKLFETFALQQSIEDLPKQKLERLLHESLKLKNDHFPQGELRSRFDETDEELHKIIIKKANNEFLQDFTQRIHNLVGLTRHLNERIDTALEEHIRLLQAMLDGNVEMSVSALEEHLDQVEEESLGKIMQVL